MTDQFLELITNETFELALEEGPSVIMLYGGAIARLETIYGELDFPISLIQNKRKREELEGTLGKYLGKGISLEIKGYRLSAYYISEIKKAA